MKVTYISHDGFIIELDKHILLFDYYKGTLPLFNPNKALYIFVSHSHRDHYNPEIYTITHPNKHYILSDDVDNNGFKMKPHEQLQIDDVLIKTLLSTDIGVAFIVELEDKRIFHAGDLNWWHWQGEPEKDNQYQEVTFKQEIEHIKNQQFDIMMLPLDPRLEEAASWSVSYILQHVKTNYVLPMHCFTRLSKMNAYLLEEPLKQYQNILKIEHKGQIFNLK